MNKSHALNPHTANPYQRERKRAGLTQEKAVEYLPFELRTLQGYEAGCRQPKFDHAYAMAELYGCSLDDFARVEEDAEDE